MSTDSQTTAADAPEAANENTPAVTHTQLPDELRTQLATIDQIVEECSLSLAADAKSVSYAIMMARGMRELRDRMTAPIMDDLMTLCGSGLGFTTDRDKEPANKQYSVEVIRDCCLEARLRGANWIGNEFTIISARPHLNKEFWERMVRELEGMTDVEVTTGVPVIKVDSGGSALVPAVARWTYRGKAYQREFTVKKNADGTTHDDRVPTKVNKGQGAAQVVGKAQRNIFRAIYKQMTGSTMSDHDPGDVIDAPSQEGTGEQVAPAEDLAGEAAAAHQAAETPDDPAPGFDYSDLLAEFRAKLLEARNDERPVVACGRALHWATTQDTGLPKDVANGLKQEHDAAVAEIKAQRGRERSP